MTRRCNRENLRPEPNHRVSEKNGYRRDPPQNCPHPVQRKKGATQVINNQVAVTVAAAGAKRRMPVLATPFQAGTQ